MKGHIHHWHIDIRRRCQGATNTDEEFDLYYFLRSRRHLRRHHGYRLFLKGQHGA